MADKLFKASGRDWNEIKRFSCNKNPGSFYVEKTIHELRDRVAALEAAPDRVLVRNQTGEYLRAGTPVYADTPPELDADAVLSLAAIIRSVDGAHNLGAAALAEAILSHPDATGVLQLPAPTPPAAVPSDEELWELARKVKKQVTPHFNWSTWDEPHGPDFGHFVAAHRALYNHGFQHGLAAGRAEQGTTPEPEPNQAPAGDHIPDATKMVPAGDGDREELARLLTADAECLEADEPDMMSIDNHQLRRAAALLRQPAPEGLVVQEYVHLDSGARIIGEPSEEQSGGCWVVRNSRHVSPFTEFPTVAAALAALEPPQGGEAQR
jgi:hypothetical protein